MGFWSRVVVLPLAVRLNILDVEVSIRPDTFQAQVPRISLLFWSAFSQARGAFASANRRCFNVDSGREISLDTYQRCRKQGRVAQSIRHRKSNHGSNSSLLTLLHTSSGAGPAWQSHIPKSIHTHTLRPTTREGPQSIRHPYRESNHGSNGHILTLIHSHLGSSKDILITWKAIHR